MRQQKHQKKYWPYLASVGAGVAVMIVTALSAYGAGGTNLDARTQSAMIDAINDEYHARAFYSAVIDKFGSVRPFSNIVQAENRHVQLWQSLFAQYGIPVPEDTFAGNVEVPNTLQAACQMGVEAEIADYQMYDRFLSFVQEPNLRAAFTQLSYVSQNNHQPAFERCAGTAMLTGLQQGRWSRGQRGRGTANLR